MGGIKPKENPFTIRQSSPSINGLAESHMAYVIGLNV